MNPEQPNNAAPTPVTNLPSAAAPVVNNNPAPVAAVPNTPDAVVANTTDGNGSKKGLFIAMGIAVLLMVVGIAGYFYFSNLTGESKVTKQQSTGTNTAQVLSELDSLIKEAEASMGDVEEDLVEVDKDLQGL